MSDLLTVVFSAVVSTKDLDHLAICVPRKAGGDDGSSVAAQITSWVESHFVSQTVDGVTVHDLTQPS